MFAPRRRRGHTLSFISPFTTSPKTRKRKASGTLDCQKEPLKKTKPEVAPAVALPATPLTTPSTPVEPTMDSDDDMMSQASTEEFDDVEESDDGSFGNIPECSQ